MNLTLDEAWMLIELSMKLLDFLMPFSQNLL